MIRLKQVFTHVTGVILCLCVMAGHGNAAQTERFVYSIQVASYQTRQQAVNAVENLKKNTLDAFYRSQEIRGKGVWYRIYIDTYASIAEAKKAAGRMQQQQIISDFYIRRIRDVEKNTTNNDMGKEKDVRLTIQDITYTTGKERNDSVCIQGDRYFWPSVTFSLQGSKPTLLVYLDNIDSSQKDLSNVMVNGTLIKDIEIRFNRDTNTIILQVTLNASDNYTISQLFNKTENIFSLEVQAGT